MYKVGILKGRIHDVYLPGEGKRDDPEIPDENYMEVEDADGFSIGDTWDYKNNTSLFDMFPPSELDLLKKRILKLEGGK